MGKIIYENVVAYAEKRGLSLRQVEIRAGLGNGTISKWKVSEPSVKSVKAVAAVLNVAVSTLLKE